MLSKMIYWKWYILSEFNQISLNLHMHNFPSYRIVVRPTKYEARIDISFNTH